MSSLGPKNPAQLKAILEVSIANYQEMLKDSVITKDLKERINLRIILYGSMLAQLRMHDHWIVKPEKTHHISKSESHNKLTYLIGGDLERPLSEVPIEGFAGRFCWTKITEEPCVEVSVSPAGWITLFFAYGSVKNFKSRDEIESWMSHREKKMNDRFYWNDEPHKLKHEIEEDV